MSERNRFIQGGNWLKMVGGRIKRHRSNVKARMRRHASKADRRAAVREVSEQSFGS